MLTVSKIVFSKEVSNKLINNFGLFLLCTMPTSLNDCSFYVLVLLLQTVKKRSAQIGIVVRDGCEERNVRFTEFLLGYYVFEIRSIVIDWRREGICKINWGWNKKSWSNQRSQSDIKGIAARLLMMMICNWNRCTESRARSGTLKI